MRAICFCIYFLYIFSFFLFLIFYSLFCCCRNSPKFFVYLTAKKRCEDVAFDSLVRPSPCPPVCPLHQSPCPFWQLSICRICQLQNALSEVGVGVGGRVLGLVMRHATHTRTRTRTHTHTLTARAAKRICQSTCAIKCNKL